MMNTETTHPPSPEEENTPRPQHPAPEADAHGSIFGAESRKDSAEEDAKDPQARIAELEEALKELQDKWMRSEADNQNLRTRHKRELEDARLYSVQKFARDVVEAAENLRRGIASLPQATEGEDSVIAKIREGLESTERSFLTVLERHGITLLDPTHQPFDANHHQAMAEQPSPEHPPGTVIQAWTPTWLLHGRLLKPAMVVVSKNAESETP